MRISDWSSDVCSSDLHPDLFMTALEIEEISRPRFTTVEGMWRKSTKKRSGSWVEWAIGEGLVKRNGDGNLLHRSEEHTSELQSLMRISYAVFCLKKKTTNKITNNIHMRDRPIYTQEKHMQHETTH